MAARSTRKYGPRVASTKRERQRRRATLRARSSADTGEPRKEPGIPGTVIQKRFPELVEDTRYGKEVPMSPGTIDGRAFRMGKLLAIVSYCEVDETTPIGLIVPQKRWRLSVSHPDRYPTWDELKYLRYKLMPDVKTMAFFLPAADEYVDCHPYCLQMWETTAAARGD